MDVEIHGFRMHYDVFGDAGSPLLWLSGWTGTGADWKFVFQDVTAGFQIIGVDLRGNGASSGFEGTHRFQQSARDVFALLDHLGIKRVKAIGLSGGGIALLHMAIQQPERIDAMVLVSVPPYFPEQARTIQRAFSFEALPEPERTRMRELCCGGEDQIAWLMEQTHKMAESTDDVVFSPETLHRIKARTLIVFGDSDPLYRVELAYELQNEIPNSSLWIVPKRGHGAIFGPHAAQFEETATGFLTCTR
ncbi:MAG TPA: alpha/beta hydrolase [Terriglobales bacterium]|nr:alpha/beta hydrolase [Terriglobales bacterium]